MRVPSSLDTDQPTGNLRDEHSPPPRSYYSIYLPNIRNHLIFLAALSRSPLLRLLGFLLGFMVQGLGLRVRVVNGARASGALPVSATQAGTVTGMTS